MAGRTHRIAISEALEDLTPEKLDKLRLQLREKRGDGPRLTRAQVDGKNHLQLADLLVETFSAHSALNVTLELLRAVGCHAVADDLESTTAASVNGATSAAQTKSSVKTNQTVTKKRPRGPLQQSKGQNAEKKRKQEDKRQEANVKKKGASVKMPQKVLKKKPKAKKSELSKQLVKFGHYKDERFGWLLQKDVRYVVYQVATYQKKIEEGDKRRTAKMKNKRALVEYVSLFPEMMKEVELYRQGEEPLGFGKFTKLTRKALYESKVDTKKKCVERLRSLKTCKDPQKKAAVEYILHRDRKKKHSLTKQKL